MSAKTLVLFVLVLLIASMAPMAWAGDVDAGKIKAIICMGCHGPEGLGADPVGSQPAFPLIAGQREAYLIQSVHEYKSGKRENVLMTPIAKGLSDEDIENLAAYYASLRQD